MYKKNYLKHVIFKLDFGPVSYFLQRDYLKKLYNDYLKELFDIYDIVTNTDISINIRDNVQTVNQVVRYQMLCKKNSNDESPSFVLDQNNMLVDMLTNYQNLETFIEVIKTCMQCLNKDDVYINRFGLRYINEIPIPVKDNPLYNVDYIATDLTSKELNFLEDDFKTKIVRSLSQTEFEFDDYKTRFVTGYFNKSYPNKMTNNEYLVDINCFTSSVEIDDIIELVTKMNKNTIENLFEKSITDKLRAIMEGENDEQ